MNTNYLNAVKILLLILFMLGSTIEVKPQDISSNTDNLIAFSSERSNVMQSMTFNSNDKEEMSTTSSAVSIGNQVWMKSNLDVSTYRNGDEIPQVQDPKEWSNLTTGAWCYYENKTENGTVYGKLYNWYAVHDPRGLAPEGWHIPSDQEWTALIEFLGGEKVAGTKMKATNSEATSEYSQFSGLMAGTRNDYKGSFMGIKTSGIWWSATPVYGSYAWYRGLYFNNPTVNRNYLNKTIGLSVRCVKD